MSETQYTNRLIHETSPYFLQHAHNPVNWYPWGDLSFLKMPKQKKNPFSFHADILLDIDGTQANCNIPNQGINLQN